MFSGLEDIIWTNINILSLHCDLDIEHNEQIFLHTLFLMMLHDHTRFGDKIFCGSEDIVQTNIHQHFELSL